MKLSYVSPRILSQEAHLTNEKGWANMVTSTAKDKVISDKKIHDVKGSKFMFQDDAKVKVKVAAEKFPFRFLVAMPKPRNKGGGWDIQDFLGTLEAPKQTAI